MRAAILGLAACAAGLALPVPAQVPSARDLYLRADKGHCIACHQLPEGTGPATRSDIGPALSGTRMRELGRDRLRDLLVDPTRANADTLMPPFGRHRILDAAEIDRLVVFLQALPAAAAADPSRGTAAAEDDRRAEAERNSIAPAAAAIVESGKKIWTRNFKNGKSLAACFPNGGRRIAASYPQYDQRLKRVVTLESAINLCLKAHNEALLDPVDADTMGAVLAYVRSLSDGQKIAVRVPAGVAQERLEQGRRQYYTRMGQRNFACASCHVQAAGKRYGEVALSPAVGQATHWPVIRGERAVTLQARIRECLELMGAAPFAPGSDELNHLEYFLTSASNGLALRANTWRPVTSRD
jgi:sulfur-oxidizing protein SoxA